MAGLYDILRPLLFRLDPESAHNLTLKALKTGLVPTRPAISNPALEVTLWERKFPNPVGLAAGFDKNAAAIGPLLQLGFGFVEVGTVTPKPQHGNLRPRIFRDQQTQSIINAMGFPNEGLNRFKANIEKFLSTRPRPAGLIGINIGMNKNQSHPIDDYVLLVHQLGPLADYLCVNISSPNTPGLRDLQKRQNLLPLINVLLEERTKACGVVDAPPLLVKLSPDLDEAQQEEIADTVIAAGIDGLVLTNTTTGRPASLSFEFAGKPGGLSGALLRERSIAMVRNFYRLTGGRVPIIGVGGIFDADDAYEKIKAGASLIQLYTGLVFGGPAVVKAINTGLLDRLRRDGLTRISEAVGVDA